MKQNLRHLFVYCSSLFFTLQSCSSYRLPDRSTTNLQYGIDQRPPLTPDHPASYNTTPIPAPHLFHHDRQHFTNNTGFIANNANSKSNPAKSYGPHRRTASPPEPPGRTPIPHPSTQKTTDRQRISSYIPLAKITITSWHGIGSIPEKTRPSRPPI